MHVLCKKTQVNENGRSPTKKVSIENFLTVLYLLNTLLCALVMSCESLSTVD